MKLLTFTVSAGQLSGSNGEEFANACGLSSLHVVDLGAVAARSIGEAMDV